MKRTYGFEICELRLCCPTKAPATLTFTSGLNIVEGASDTGKSYAVSCIDFLLGAKDSPEDIKESEGYDVGYLLIKICSTQSNYTLKRALSGGSIGLFHGTVDEALLAEDTTWKTLGSTSRARNSLSDFLLNQCGLTNKFVRKNRYGKTKKASFRDLSRIIIIDEQRIIAKRSPLLGTQRPNHTAGKNTIQLLLTGVDDSQIVQPEDQKVATGRMEGKKEVVRSLIGQEESTLKVLQDKIEHSISQKEIVQLDQLIADLTESTNAALSELRSAERERREAWIIRREADERSSDLNSMLVRADLLRQHYISDLRRLEAMAESAHVLSYYPEHPCAYCGAEPGHQNQSDIQTLQRTVEGAQVEATKIQQLKSELRRASAQLTNERNVLREQIDTIDKTISGISNSIENELAPRKREVLSNLSTMQRQYGEQIRIVEIQCRLDSLRQQLHDLEKDSGTTEKMQFRELTASKMAGVCKEISTLIEAWAFTEESLVAFDEKTADIQIDGRRRVSHGKGVRALTCAAFVIALMRHGIKHELGHPGLVILDTPLNPYKAADVTDDGAVSQPVKTSFYRHLCNESLGQVIIFENVPAPQQVKDNCNCVHFSGSQVGRNGFFPNLKDI